MTGRALARRQPTTLAVRRPPSSISRAYNPSWQQFANWRDSFFSFQGGAYGPSGYSTTMPGSKVEPPSETFAGYVQSCYKANGIIFAVSMARARPFSEVRFKFRRYGESGGGNDLFGNEDLQVLERPWPGGTTQSMLIRAEQDVTAGGTFFLARSVDGTRLLRRRPDWMEFILTAPPDEAVESDIVGYKYTAGGPMGGGPSKLYTLDECTHWSPIPDPDSQYRGMSWISPVIKEFMGDQASTDHKLKFFENAATPNLAVSLKESVTFDQFQQFVRESQEASQGIDNAYKTLYLGGGADVTPIGVDLRQLDFAVTQGHGETRVAAAGGVPPIVVGLSEGLQAATYSNYGQAKRAYGDLFLRSQWRSFVGAVAPLVRVPANAELWYDAADVAFLREDALDLANQLSVTAATINALIAGGFEPDTTVVAVLAEDLSKLKHTGMLSVQLQAPGAQQDDPAADDAAAEDPAADDAAAEAIDSLGRADVGYSRGMDGTVTRHQPGHHNQKSHGNRIGKHNIPGKTGLAKAAATLEASPEHGPARPPSSPGAQFDGLTPDQTITKRRLYSHQNVADDPGVKAAEAEYRRTGDVAGRDAYLAEVAAATEHQAQTEAARIPAADRYGDAIPARAATDPAVRAALTEYQDAIRQRVRGTLPAQVPETREEGEADKVRRDALADAQQAAKDKLDTALDHAYRTRADHRKRTLEADHSDHRLVNALTPLPAETEVRAVYDQLYPPVPRTLDGPVREAAEAARRAQVDAAVAEHMRRRLQDRAEEAGSPARVFGSAEVDAATPAQRDALRQEYLRLQDDAIPAAKRREGDTVATVRQAVDAETAAKRAAEDADKAAFGAAVDRIKAHVGELPNAADAGKAAGKALRKEIGIPSATAVKKLPGDQRYAAEAAISAAEEVASTEQALANYRAQVAAIGAALEAGGLSPAVKTKLVATYNQVRSDTDHLEHQLETARQDLEHQRQRWMDARKA